MSILNMIVGGGSSLKIYHPESVTVTSRVATLTGITKEPVGVIFCQASDNSDCAYWITDGNGTVLDAKYTAIDSGFPSNRSIGGSYDESTGTFVLSESNNSYTPFRSPSTCTSNDFYIF